MVNLQAYLLVSAMLFAIGMAGVMVRRNVIIIFMCLELMLTAANVSLVAFWRFGLEAGQALTPADMNAQVLVFFIITVAAAEVAVGLAIIVALFRAKRTTDVTDMVTMRN